MRKIVLLVLTVLLTLVTASAAFAGQTGYQSDSFVFEADDQYLTTGGNQSENIITKVFYNEKDSNWYYCRYDKEWHKHYYYKQCWKDCQGSKYRHIWHRHWSYDNDREKYFYVDENGINRYFYLDPDREYEVHQYQDHNGVTQFYFKASGWK
jgi:hypothetical protein